MGGLRFVRGFVAESDPPPHNSSLIITIPLHLPPPPPRLFMPPDVINLRLFAFGSFRLSSAESRPGVRMHSPYATTLAFYLTHNSDSKWRCMLGRLVE